MTRKPAAKHPVPKLLRYYERLGLLSAERHDAQSILTNIKKFEPYAAEKGGVPLEHDKMLIITITPRVGSWWMVDLLKSTSAYGIPGEYLDNWAIDKFLPEIKAPNYLNMLGALQKKFCAADGFFVAKTSLYGLMRLFHHSGAAAMRRVRYVHMTRADLLGQAISLSIAHKTDAWNSLHTSKAEPTYNFDDIAHQLNRITNEDAAIRRFYTMFGIKPLMLQYENIKADPQLAVMQIHQYAQRGGSALIVPELLKIKSQHSPLNEQFRKKFLADFIAIGAAKPAAKKKAKT